MANTGEVTDPSGAPIPKVDVELLDNQSTVLQQVVSDADGHFSIATVMNGEYILRARSPYFVNAWQPLVVEKTMQVAVAESPYLCALISQDGAAQWSNRNRW